MYRVFHLLRDTVHHRHVAFGGYFLLLSKEYDTG